MVTRETIHGPLASTQAVVRLEDVRRGRPALDLFQAPGCVLVQQAGDQRLIRQALGERPFWDCLQILTRQTDIQPAVLAERGLGIANVASSLAFAAAGGLPFTALDGLEQVLLVSVSSRKGGGFSDRRTERKRPKEALLSGDSKRLDETRLTGCLRSRATSGQRNRRNRP